MSKKGLMICSTAAGSMRLNEAASAVDNKYVLEGVFAELDTMNRNSRIYTKNEYLKHLQYLRDDIKRGDNPIGELDHPDDRFEVKLKEASHRILDLWYDENKNVIMGKIELLDTPNGKIAKSLVDQNIPLHISSRAAGTVNSDNTVSIQQIYTYDLVCKPGFANAVLHRVNESADEIQYDDATKDVFNKMNKTESMNIASKLGITDEGVAVTEVDSTVSLRAEAQKIQEDELSEAEPEEKVEEEGEVKEETPEEDKKEDEIEGVSIIKISPVFGVDIMDVKPEYSEDENPKEDKKEEDEKEGGEKENTEEEKSEENESEDTNECDVKADEETPKTTEKNKLFDCDKAESVKAREDKFNDNFEKLVAAIKEKGKGAKKQNESLLTQYPVSGCLNESNFVEFAALSESQKEKVVAYLQDNKIMGVDGINENWKNGINYERQIPIWLQRAPEQYRALYENASDAEKVSISTTANYLIFESQSDIDNFWYNSGLSQKMERQMINESFIKNIPNISSVETNSKSYDKSFIDNVVEMARSFNSKY